MVAQRVTRCLQHVTLPSGHTHCVLRRLYAEKPGGGVHPSQIVITPQCLRLRNCYGTKLGTAHVDGGPAKGRSERLRADQADVLVVCGLAGRGGESVQRRAESLTLR